MQKTLNKWRSPASMMAPRQNMKSTPRPDKERVQHTETITAHRATETRGKISNIYQETGEVRPGNIGGAAIWGGVNEIGIHHGTRRRCRRLRLTRPLFQYASSPRNLHADNSGPQSDGVGVDVVEQSGVAWKEKNNKGIKVSWGAGGCEFKIRGKILDAIPRRNKPAWN